MKTPFSLLHADKKKQPKETPRLPSPAHYTTSLLLDQSFFDYQYAPTWIYCVCMRTRNLSTYLPHNPFAGRQHGLLNFLWLHLAWKQSKGQTLYCISSHLASQCRAWVSDTFWISDHPQGTKLLLLHCNSLYNITVWYTTCLCLSA